MPFGKSYAVSQPSAENTQCATGSYTRNDQASMNTRKVLNLARSAKAPVISAGVMMANIAWKIMNASWGTPVAEVYGSAGSGPTALSPKKGRGPEIAPPPGP